MVKEKKNGLYFVLNDYELRYISDYSPTWTPEYDSNSQFVNWDGTALGEQYKGIRYSASITTSAMTEEDTDALITELQKIVINFKSAPRTGLIEFEGAVKINDYRKQPVAITDADRFYKVSFNVVAVALQDSSGSL